MAGTARKLITRVFVSLLLIALVGAAVVAYVFRQDIRDEIAASQFEPTAEVVALAERIDLTPRGQRVFWATHPTLDASQTFNEQCAQVDHIEEGHVLGCYVDGQIHLFYIMDERLNGIIEVTAVHELLHAGFARLDQEQRTSLVAKLNDLYGELSATDPVLTERMQVYEGLSKTAFANELHSVLGTEVRELPAWLDEHYAVWLEDRTLIVDYFESYRSIFDDLKRQADTLQQELADLRADVERRTAAYEADVEQYNEEWAAFLQRNEAYEFSNNPDEFYRIREDFYDRRAALGAERDQLNADIARYEELRNQLLELSELNHELTQQLDSGLAPPAVSVAEDSA